MDYFQSYVDEDGDEINTTPLHEAAHYGRTNIVQTLIEAGADVSGPSKDAIGATPLYFAAIKGCRDIIDLLLAAGADVAHETKDHGFTALHLAVIMDHEDSVDALLSHASATKSVKDALLCARAEPEKGRSPTALHLAAIHGHKGVVERLLFAGAAVDTQESQSGCTALDFAAASGHEDIVEALLLHNAEVNGLRRRPTHTSLHLAAGYGRMEATRKLLSAGAEINAVDSLGETPLDAAKTKYCASTGITGVDRDNARLAEVVSLLKSKGAKTGREMSKS